MDDENAILDSIVARVEKKFAGKHAGEVRSISYKLYVDSTDDDAVRFRVILANRPDDELHDPAELQVIDDALAQELRSRGIERIPYAEFATESEDASSNDGGDLSASPGHQA